MSTAYEIPTFQDAYEHLCLVFGIQSTTINDRKCRAAVLQAFNDFVGARRWNRYQSLLRIVTSARQTSSTITYTHTGGSSERMVTLASGTWPTWAELGELVIDSVVYPVDKRVSSTVLTLYEAYNPGANVAAGTSYAIQRDTYSLPDDFYQMGRLIDVQSRRLLWFETPEEQLLRKRAVSWTGIPTGFAVVSHPKYTGGLAVRFDPIPTTARTFDGMYWRSPRSLRLVTYATGTVSVTAGTATVTGAATPAWTTQANGIRPGAVIRFGLDGTNAVTSTQGYLSGYYPFVEQGVIRSIDSATQITLEQATTYTHAAVKYTISDPIDMEAGAQLNYFWRLLEAKYAQLDSRQDAAARAAVAYNEMLWAKTEDTKLVMPEPYDIAYAGLGTIAGDIDVTP